MPFESEVANQILITPLDSKCIVKQEIYEKLNRGDFLERCYSYPVFSEKYKRGHSIKYDSSYEIEYDLFSETQDTRIKHYYNLERVYTNFINWLNAFNENTNSKIYTLSGNSGTGKTTYLYHLQKEYKDRPFQKIEIIILDVAKKNDSISWFGDYVTNISNVNRAEKKMYGSILRKIHDLLFIVSNEDELFLHKTFQNIKRIINNYKRFFYNKGIKGSDFFAKIIDSINDEESDEKNIKNIAKTFHQYFHGKDKAPSSFTYALDIYLILLRCQRNSNKKCFAIIFDNLERFIDNHEVYNRDLDAIRDSLRNYQNLINNPQNHNYTFKFIMAIRCNSARIVGAKTHDKDAMPNDVDVTKWYDISDIILKKNQWYQQNNISITQFEMLNKIINDEWIINNSITGLKRLLNPLFNYNKRLVVDFIGEMIENPSYSSVLDVFNSFYAQKSHSGITRFAARSIFRETLFKKLSRCDNMFDYFLINNKKNPLEKKNDYARQILTLLYNKYHTEDDAIMTLDEVLDLMKINREEMSFNKYCSAKKYIASILFHLNSYNRRNNDWIQFIDLQYHNGKNDSVFISTLGEMNQLMKEDKNLSNFELVIMDAGIVYLQNIYASMEFFSIMYCGNDKPIFSLIPTVEEINTNSTNGLELIKRLRSIFIHAKERIKFIKDNDFDVYEIRSSSVDSDGLGYIEHIIRMHTNYINLLINYIEEIYKKNSGIIEDKLNQLTACLLGLNNKYKELL